MDVPAMRGTPAGAGRSWPDPAKIRPTERAIRQDRTLADFHCREDRAERRERDGHPEPEPPGPGPRLGPGLRTIVEDSLGRSGPHRWVLRLTLHSTSNGLALQACP